MIRCYQTKKKKSSCASQKMKHLIEKKCAIWVTVRQVLVQEGCCKNMYMTQIYIETIFRFSPHYYRHLYTLTIKILFFDLSKISVLVWSRWTALIQPGLLSYSGVTEVTRHITEKTLPADTTLLLLQPQP